MTTKATFINSVFAKTYKDGRQPSETNKFEFTRILWEAEVRHLLSKKGIPSELANYIVTASEPEHLIPLGPNGQRIKAKICQKAYFRCILCIVKDQLKDPCSDGIYCRVAEPVLHRMSQEAHAVECLLKSEWF